VTQNEDKLLGDGLAALEASATGFGGFSGARFAARWLKTVIHEVTVELSMDELTSIRRARSVLSQCGQLVSEGSMTPDLLQAVVGGGTGGLNPVVVTVRITAGRPGVSVLNIRTAAKEGLIKQHSAERMATRIGELLADTSGL